MPLHGCVVLKTWVAVGLQHRGQVYIPLINYLLMTLCLVIVGTFQTSANIGKAYGEQRPLEYDVCSCPQGTH